MDKEIRLGQELIILSRQIDKKISKGVAQYGITSIQAKVISFVYRESPKRDVFQKNIEGKFDIKPSSVTSVLNLMEHNGYIKRISVAEDARLKKIVLTDKGLESYSAVFQTLENVESLLSEALAHDEVMLLLDLINKLSKKIAE